MRPEKKENSYWLFVLFIIFALGCGSDEDRSDISAYYFPFDSLSDGKFYVYTSTDSRFAPQYWYVRSHQLDSVMVLTTQVLNHRFDVDVSAVEERVSNGTRMRKLTVTEEGAEGKSQLVEANIVHDAVFPFFVRDSLSAFVYRVQWTSADSLKARTTTLIRNRRFYGFTKRQFEGETIPCVKMRARELLRTDEVGGQELEYDSWEYYAEGIGLLGFRKEITVDLVMDYKLEGIYDLATFETTFRTEEQLGVDSLRRQ